MNGTLSESVSSKRLKTDSNGSYSHQTSDAINEVSHLATLLKEMLDSLLK
jgi:HAMP domain-containing protein